MKNKIRLQYFFLTYLIIIIISSIIFFFINRYEYNTYTKNYNYKINSIVNLVKDKYPDITESEIIEIINQVDDSSPYILYKYGIDLDNSSVILDNKNKYDLFLIINISFVIVVLSLLLISFIIYNKKKDKDIKDITKCIEQINKKNYELQIDSNTEDELSILKNEIYKTTITLKEAVENSLKDKANLKKSLEDISHQLKTPLTSILVMLDNIIDDPEMDEDTRNEFIRDIKRNVVNINFLVQALLKLSKFDANTIHFIKKETYVRDIIDDSIKNVSTICDLKNISVESNLKLKSNASIVCDKAWQVEAITNILKNAIDHSKEGSKVLIKSTNHNVYSKIEIIDFGDGISPKDIPHIFERFYKGSNASADSIGIGLALAKTIIEEDNGTIDVESNDKGTKFTIKYFKI